ncbi:MAG TPA: T9SS type A sorting domain-containing protein, partial [bacterium]
QNFPNPFNPTTTIRFELRDASFVRLGVYDISGRLVMELANGWREAGVQEVTFDGSKLASGIYVYRIAAGDFSASGKMMLMK